MKYTCGLLAALSLSFSVCVSNAATITFDDAVGGNPAGTYTEAGYLFTPNSATKDVKCYDAGCLKEFKQGEITTMIKDGGGVFDLLGFYFALIGNDSAAASETVGTLNFTTGYTTINLTGGAGGETTLTVATALSAQNAQATGLITGAGLGGTGANSVNVVVAGTYAVRLWKAWPTR